MGYFDEPYGPGLVKIQTTSKNIEGYYTPKHLIMDLLSKCCSKRVKEGECDSFACARQPVRQVFRRTNNCTISLFGRYSLQMDNNTQIFPSFCWRIFSHVMCLDQSHVSETETEVNMCPHRCMNHWLLDPMGFIFTLHIS